MTNELKKELQSIIADWRNRAQTTRTKIIQDYWNDLVAELEKICQKN